MTKFTYFTACTLDGYIADADNSLQWLFDVPVGENDTAVGDFIDEVGVLVMGATTYSWMLGHEDVLDRPEKWREWYGDRPTWVFTHRDLPSIPGAEVRFVAGDVRDQLGVLRQAAGDRMVWLVGGGELVGAFDDAGALDELRLGMVPVTLGAGAPVLPRRITSERLSLVQAHQVGQRVDLRYAVRRREVDQSAARSIQ
ncbi:dihydrofolate reductase family protein [Flexivirga caeni]|uniref:Dihydrofolate reductase n=1 Tax=Flexivirga caeni TaxID=2294115 RepID=A0A3M9MAL1_9MICO|nr:dihydrofolate reductase family protein [Flexivirga caeni]RNI22207.1 dihydrofolate reductase [Flexivirga caeni]